MHPATARIVPIPRNKSRVPLSHYRHQSGAIGFSQSLSAKELCQELIRHCYEQTTSRGRQTTVDPYYVLKHQYGPDLTSQIILTKNAKSRKSWYEYWFYTHQNVTEITPTGVPTENSVRTENAEVPSIHEILVRSR